MKKDIIIYLALIVLVPAIAVAAGRAVLQNGSGVEIGTTTNPINVSIASTGSVQFGDDQQAVFGTTGDFAIYYDSDESASVINTVTTTFIKMFSQPCMVFESPDGTFSKCCVDNGDNWTCVAE